MWAICSANKAVAGSCVKALGSGVEVRRACSATATASRASVGLSVSRVSSSTHMKPNVATRLRKKCSSPRLGKSSCMDQMSRSTNFAMSSRRSSQADARALRNLVYSSRTVWSVAR